MGKWRKLFKLFGRQYTMVRYAEEHTYAIRRAYCIGGYWYVRSTARAKGHWMLTNGNRVTDIEKTGTGFSGDVDNRLQLWLPITNRVDAGVRMYE